jgi:glycosyltransferase involved in cell wall biosynthesis
MKVLLISPYDTDSHRYWRKQLENNLSEINWTVVTLPGRNFAWRTRGSALNLLTKKEEFTGQAYDRILTTSMLDIACFKSVFPEFVDTPITTYFHENQFEYPISSKQQTSAELHIWTVYNALLSEKKVFNSEYNKRTFLLGVADFLKKMPDLVPDTTLDDVERNCEVIPVPIPEIKNDIKKEGSKLRLLWNHRWEYDKAPEKFHKALTLLRTIKPDFELVLLGKGEIPAEISNDFCENIVKAGFISSREEYIETIRHCDFVISTAIHEFQGISVLEAVSLGCCPILPNRVVYPDIFLKKYLYESHLNDELKEAEALVQKICEFTDGKLDIEGGNLKNVCRNFQWNGLRERYLNCLS